MKIAAAILQTTINSLSKEWGVTMPWVMSVAEGIGTSARIEKKIDETIKEAKKTVPFYPPTKGQTKGQSENNDNRHKVAV